ncbi:PucR family transcriptional regulator [Paenibacillus sp. JDR-2]|uniref:PucR family transcriptional regulator n=1 Tax=Paenibacillus sp. (strain JDR-2) TaxID=324057 RepID=UPI0001668C97|nr:PucR family transcriptional regulator [Paenibacillus sp. JDR-2]ACT03299.1 transcriptional regulator, CdaR [Paenibacillus sp. JDR-2]
MVETLMQLTVRDILQRPLFQKAETIASEEALNRTVRWVHIMEVTQIGKLLSGNELILSTGIGWHDDEELSLSFLRQLIDSGASGLCIELGTYTKKPSDAMIELAERENFPLLFFHEEVRYIDITQDLHAYFIHQHHRMVYELEALSTKLNQLLLSGKGIMPLLKLLHHTTGTQVAFFPLNAEAEFIPHMPKAKADSFYEQWIYGEMFATPDLKRGLAHRPILALDHLFADLLLQSEQELSEFQVLALDRCATAIAQEMMRTKYMEERRRYKDEMWVTDWLSGKHAEKEVREYISSIRPAAKLYGLTVCIFRLNLKLAEWKEGEELLIQKNMVARAIFEGEGYFLLPAILHDHIVFVLIDQMKQLKWKDRLLRAIDRLRKTEHNPDSALFAGTLGIGKYLTDLSRAKEGYESAQETVAIQTDIGPLSSPFFNDLHTYRIISGLKKTGMLPALIEEYIGPLARYDQEKNGQLLKTLKVFLSLSGSKQDTAKELFIVRQTLYHRLEKIASLLGDDYLVADKRLAIELALNAYEYTYGAIP